MRSSVVAAKCYFWRSLFPLPLSLFCGIVLRLAGAAFSRLFRAHKLLSAFALAYLNCKRGRSFFLCETWPDCYSFQPTMTPGSKINSSCLEKLLTFWHHTLNTHLLEQKIKFDPKYSALKKVEQDFKKFHAIWFGCFKYPKHGVLTMNL